MSIAVAVPACAGDSDEDIDPSLTLLQRAILGVGGLDALEGLSTLRLQAAGTWWIQGEGDRPEDPADEVSVYQLDLAMWAIPSRRSRSGSTPRPARLTG